MSNTWTNEHSNMKDEGFYFFSCTAAVLRLLKWVCGVTTFMIERKEEDEQEKG